MTPPRSQALLVLLLAAVAGFKLWRSPHSASNLEIVPDSVEYTVGAERLTAHLGYTLSTVDGCKTWVPGSQSILGHVTKVRFRTDGTGLGLVEHADSFRYPSEVYKLDWKTGKSETVFRDKRYAISDIWFGKDGSTYLAGVELQGTVRSVMPGRVRAFRSTDLKG